MLKIILMVFFVFLNALPGQEPQTRQATLSGETKIVVVTGVGTNREGAINDGLRSAVEQAIGIYIQSESVVENYQLIQDQILTYSRGYVESYEVVNETSGTGLSRITISAEVVIKRLEARLIELNLYEKAIKGKDLFAKAYTEINMTKKGASLYKDLRQDFPEKALRITFGETDITTDGTEKVQIRVPCSFSWNENYLTRVIEVLEQTADTIVYSKEESDRINRQKQFNHPVTCIRVRPGEERFFETGTDYFINRLYAEELFRLKIDNRMRKEHVALRLHVSLVDDDGTQVVSETIDTGIRLVQVHYWGGESSGPMDTVYINRTDKHYSKRGRWIQFEVSLDQLAKIASVTGYCSL